MCRCTAKVANLTITAMYSNCILHRQGRVTIDSCQLECYAGGLGHLFSPLTTMAVSGLSRQQRLQATLRKQEVGMGVLSVSETLIRVRQSGVAKCHDCMYALAYLTALLVGYNTPYNSTRAIQPEVCCSDLLILCFGTRRPIDTTDSNTGSVCYVNASSCSQLCRNP